MTVVVFSHLIVMKTILQMILDLWPGRFTYLQNIRGKLDLSWNFSSPGPFLKKPFHLHVSDNKRPT